MDPEAIIDKFGDEYTVDDHTFVMGIDRRFTTHFARRFKGLVVLETCTGAGFTTMSLARAAKHVFTVEIDRSHQEQAISNIEKAGLSDQVSFLHGDILEPNLLKQLPAIDAAFLDPDWAVSGPEHIYRFTNSNTRPPADTLLGKILEMTANVAMVLPPYVDTREFDHLPKHERESLYLGESHELYCLYFGSLINNSFATEFRA